jgi:hypothetical protein
MVCLASRERRHDAKRGKRAKRKKGKKGKFK